MAGDGAVAVLFTDLEGSTRLWDRDPDAMHAALARHDEIVCGAVTAFDGAVFASAGDSFGVIFPTVTAAVRCAAQVQRELSDEVWPADLGELRVRLGIHVGRVLRRGGDCYGPTVNRCARLHAVGHGGQTLLSAAAAAELRAELPAGMTLRSLGSHQLKDLSEPMEVFQLGVRGLPEEFPPLRSLDNPRLRHNLPTQMTSLVGRSAEMQTVRDLLDESRLVTLVGSGGVGKTRLALQVGADLLDGSGDGVWFADLAPLTDRDLVAATVASVLNVRPGDRAVEDALADALGSRRLLLVLDNCEHVIDAAAKLADHLLRAAPQLVVLATSREPLQVTGERIYRLPSLSVPAEDAGDVAAIQRHDAVRLFVERAVAQRPGFALDESTARTVADICRSLDGIPFAIELAATRVGMLGLEDLADRLNQRFRLLTGGSRTALPRQRTLEALIDWSFDLLTLTEQELLRRLSVFAGGFDLEDVEAVCAGGGVDRLAVLDLCRALLDKSLIQLVDGSHSRYRLLETMREYAAAKLTEAPGGEELELRRAHRDYFVELAERAGAQLQRAGQRVWMDTLERNYDNLRAALTYSLSDTDPIPGLRLVVALEYFWWIVNHGSEVITTVEAHLSRADGAPARLRGQALLALSKLYHRAGDFDRVEARAEQAIELGRRSGDDAIVADAYGMIGLAQLGRGDAAAAVASHDLGIELARGLTEGVLTARLLGNKALCQMYAGQDPSAAGDESLLIHGRAGNLIGVAMVTGMIGYYALEKDDFPTARRLLEHALATAEEVGNLTVTAILGNLGITVFLLGDVAEARRLFARSVEEARRENDPLQLAYALCHVALTLSDDDPLASAGLHGASDELFKEISASLSGHEIQLRVEDHARLAERLTADGFVSAYDEGRRMAVGDAIRRWVHPLLRNG